MIEIKEYVPGIKPDGFIANMPADVYHATEGFISSTGLNLIAQSPRHFIRRKELKSDAIALGSAFHMMMLEPKKFLEEYFLLPGCYDKRTAVYKAAKEEHGEERIIIGRDLEKMQEMQHSMLSCPEVAELLELPGYTELSLFTKDPVTGVGVRVRYDKLIIVDGEVIPVDVKTARDASPDGFSKAIHERQYHVQGALYTDAFYWSTGWHAQTLRHLVVENEEPYNAMRYKMDDLSMRLGRHLYRQAINTYAECVKTGVWGGYAKEEGDTLISVPEYVINRMEDELGLDAIYME